MESKDTEKENTEQAVLFTQVTRKQTIRQTCGRGHWSVEGSLTISRYQSRSLLVDDHLKVIYCVVPKVACTNMKNVLVNLSRQQWGPGDVLRNTSIDVHNPTKLAAIGLNYLHTYNAMESQQRLEDYYKFMFVRDPLERLLSAYLDKFVKKNKWTRYFHMNYGRFIIQTFRDNPSPESLANGSDVKFSEFVKFVIFQWRRKERPDNHWMPMVDLCHPCTLRYDFIGKFETLTRDSSFLLDKIFTNSTTFHFPQSRNSGGPTRKHSEEYYRNIPLQDMNALYKIYHEDFVLFGYDRSH